MISFIFVAIAALEHQQQIDLVRSFVDSVFLDRDVNNQPFVDAAFHGRKREMSRQRVMGGSAETARIHFAEVGLIEGG